jgi:hypothetical protein
MHTNIAKMKKKENPKTQDWLKTSKALVESKNTMVSNSTPRNIGNKIVYVRSLCIY